MTTTKDAHGRAAQLRAISVLTKRPDHARAIKGGSARVRDGLTCTYEEDGARAVMDMAETMGGNDDAPAPGFFARAGLAGCIAIGIKMTALREDVPVTDVTVRLAQDWDGRGVLGMPGAAAAAEATRLEIDLESAAPPDVLDALVEAALACDPWFLSFRDAQPVTVAVRVADGAV